MSEALFCEPSGHLFGVLTRPDPCVRAPAVVVLNAGFVDSAGPFRLGIDLCQRAVDLGFVACRIDLSGKGESPKRRGLTTADSLLRDFDAVAGTLSEGGAERIVLIGLCSGADDAIRVASVRDLVVGIAMLDGIALAGPRHWLTHYGRRVLQPGAWIRRLKRFGEADEEGSGSLELDRWDDPGGLVDQLAACMDRDVRVRAIFTGGVEHYYNHAGQLSRAVGRRPELVETYHPHLAHVMPIPEQRAEVVDLLGEWLDETFPPVA